MVPEDSEKRGKPTLPRTLCQEFEVHLKPSNSIDKSHRPQRQGSTQVLTLSFEMPIGV
jgi:hypothetical protein